MASAVTDLEFHVQINLPVYFGIITYLSFQNHNTHLGKIGEALNTLSDDTKAIKMNLLKRDMQTELALADAEGDIIEFLPFNELNELTDELMSNETSAKVFATHVWYMLVLKGHKEPDIATVVNKTADLMFTPDLLAYIYINNPLR